MKLFLQQSQKTTDSVSKWNVSNYSGVNVRSIRTNIGSVLVGTVPFDSNVNGVLIC